MNVRIPRLGLTVATLIVTLSGCAGDEPVPEEALPDVPGTVRLTPEQLDAAGIQVSPVETLDLRQTVQVPGSVAPPDTAQAVVGSIAEGRVVRVRVLPGDAVRAGQTLVEIHTHELSDAQAALSAAESEFDYAREAALRAERLHEAGAISLEELQNRRAAFRRAEAEMERATEMVEHLYPTSAGNASVVAPHAGVVFTVHAQPGQVVLPGSPMVHMGTTDILWVTAYVPEGTSAALEPGDEVRVSFRSVPDVTAQARLVRVGRYVNPGNRSVEMRFELRDPPPGVHPGAFATVDITTTSAFRGMELPEDAAVRMGGRDAVFVEEETGLFRAQDVTVLPIRPGLVAVQGIPEGARVVVEGAYFLKSTMEAGEGEAQ
jgi:cobalt-zinc-cadmium efflux system membrane fusion protein